MWVLVIGDPVDGFRFIGPFTDFEDARRHAEGNAFDPWWACELEDNCKSEPTLRDEVRRLLEDYGPFQVIDVVSCLVATATREQEQANAEAKKI